MCFLTCQAILLAYMLKCTQKYQHNFFLALRIGNYKLRKAFFKFCRRHYELISKLNVGLKSLLHRNQNVMVTKTAITLTQPTVGRQSADLSADDRPIYRPIKCQILALFLSADKKINYNYLVIFFPSADSFGVLAIGRRSADGRPTICLYVGRCHI